MDFIDNVIADGYKLSKLEDRSRLDIMKAAIEAASNRNPTQVYSRLRTYWSGIQTVAARYPDSETVRQAMMSVKGLAKDKLPEDRYRTIYEWTN